MVKNNHQLAIIPPIIASPSTYKWQSAITMIDGDTSHIVPIQQTIKIEFKNGKFSCDGINLEEIDLANIRDTDISKLDLPTLRVLYSIVLHSLIEKINKSIMGEEEILNHKVSLKIPELMRSLGMQPNANRQHVDALINKIRSYQNMIGIIYVPGLRGKMYEDRYAVLVWISDRVSKNIITFEAPYLNALACHIIQDSIRYDKTGAMECKKNGQPKLEVSHSYLMKSTIASEKNKRAVEVVKIICDVIEQTGSSGKVPHISAREIINRHPQLQYALDNIKDPANKNRLLKSTLKKAWELLHTQTLLEERYKEIKFPNFTTTMAKLDVVFEFPHKGKKH